jgi:hypothetical protein
MNNGMGGSGNYNGISFNSALPSFSGNTGGTQVDTVRRLRRNGGGGAAGGNNRNHQQRPSSAGRINQREQRVEFSVNSDPVWRS